MGGVNGSALLVPHLVGTQTVRSERGNVEMEWKCVRRKHGTLCNTEGASSARRLRRLRMTPQLCRCRLFFQFSSSFVDFSVFFSVWSVAPAFLRRPDHHDGGVAQVVEREEYKHMDDR